MEPTLDQVHAELADIHDELLATAPVDFERRSGLRERENERRQLTATINKAMDEGHGLEEVEARLKEIIGQMRSSG